MVDNRPSANPDRVLEINPLSEGRSVVIANYLKCLSVASIAIFYRNVV